MPNIKSLQIERNSSSQDEWAKFQSHRNIVSERMLAAARAFVDPKIVVLGAGNCNDFCLTSCCDAYAKVDLVDIDGNALQRAITRLPKQDKVTLIQNWDLTGCIDFLDGEGNIEGNIVASDLISRIDSDVSCGHSSGYEVVMSTCVLSQLIEATTMPSSLSSNEQTNVALRTRYRHLREMIRLLCPGGIGMLMTDFVSSDTCPEILACGESEIVTIAKHCLADQNFFTGTNPFRIRHELLEQFQVAAVVRKPWRWLLGKRAYLVTSIEFQVPGEVVEFATR